MQRTDFFIDNGDGWELDVKRYGRPDRFVAERPPLLFIPGYCMNTFILAFHPTGRSLVEFMVDEGYEVWTANMRGQGDARRRGSSRPVTFDDWCDVDLPGVIDFVLRRTASTRPEAVLVGCSLGGSIAYAYLARRPERHRLCATVAMGAPLRWPAIPIWARPVIGWPQLLGRVRIRGTRRLARTLLPVVRRAPALVSIYMNAQHIDLAQADALTQTVDDPEPGINEALIRWVKDRDLIVGQTNVTIELKRAAIPLLSVYANGDGIVPPAVARAVVDYARPGTATLLEAGDANLRFAHADMFINDHAESRVFVPLARWLATACG